LSTALLASSFVVDADEEGVELPWDIKVFEE
jgi:hypothetical protein